MKANEILELLKNEAVVFKKEYMKVKRNKIVRGTYYEYYIGDVKIRKNQFEALPLKIISRVGGTTSYVYRNDTNYTP